MLRAVLILLLALADDPALRAAREHFTLAKRAFEAGDYETAVREFTTARELKPSPLLDFNIALAHERLGRLDLALDGYRSYLQQDPAAPNRAEVEERIRKLEGRIAREGAYSTSPPAPDAGDRRSSAAPAPPEMPSPPQTGGQLPDAPGRTAAPRSAGADGVARTPPPPRFALGARIGATSAGGLGQRALGGTASVRGAGRVISLPIFRAALPAPDFQVEGGVALAGYGGEATLDILSLRAKLDYVRHVSPRLDLAFCAGLDLNSASFSYKDKMEAQHQASFQPALGLWIEALTLRAILAERHELVVSPLNLHLLPAFVASGQDQILNPATGQMEAPARALDLSKGSVAYSFEIGWAYRF